MKTWIVRPCTARELAQLYKVSYRVFLNHLKPHLDKIGERIGHFYMMKQVMIIIDILGSPPGDVDIIYPRPR
ncbi:MAG TPA: hypothetical protein VIM65_01640 [Cyclobacteriaceae bacterium]